MTMGSIMRILLAAAVFLAALVVLTVLFVQLILLSLTERRFRFLRWATLAVPALALYCGARNESVVEAGAAGALLLGWGLAWASYKFLKRREAL